MGDHNLMHLAEQVRTREDLALFINALIRKYTDYPQEWPNRDLDTYFEGMISFVEASPIWYSNNRPDVDPNVPTWRLFADFLLAASVRS